MLAPYEDKSLLANLLELYNHDMSEFYGDLRLNEHGRFGYRWLDHYWTDAERFPYLVRVDGMLAGFALVRIDKGVRQIAEFFVLRRFRRQSIATTASQMAFANHPGRWEVRHASANEAAAVLWQKAVPDSATRADEGTETVYRFEVAA